MQLAPITAATAWSGLSTLARPLSEATGDFASLLSSAGDQLTASHDAPPEATSAALADQQRLAAQNKLTGESLRVDFSRSQADADLAQVQQQLEEMFRAAGVDLSQDVRLTIDGTGQVRVAGDHPDKAKIEQLLADQPQLSNELRRLSATYNVLRAAEAHSEFAAAYAKDPQAAVAAFSHLFTDHAAPQSVFVINEFQAVVETE